LPSSFSEELLTLLHKHKLSLPEAQEALQSLISSSEQEESFPLSIITEELTVLESLVRYLKEERAYSLHSIAEILGRNEKNLWHAYHNATHKKSTPLHVDPSSPTVPLKIFIEQRLSPLETLVVYLKEQRQLSYHEIAELLQRDDRTIWTTYMRAKKKDA
jgi:DNA-directed RNA polymerase specialized sigma24 family protein